MINIIISLLQHNFKIKGVSDHKMESLHKKFEILYEINLRCLFVKRCCVPITVVDSKTIAFDLTNILSHCGDLTILMVEIYCNWYRTDRTKISNS